MAFSSTADVPVSFTPARDCGVEQSVFYVIININRSVSFEKDSKTSNDSQNDLQVDDFSQMQVRHFFHPNGFNVIAQQLGIQLSQHRSEAYNPKWD